MNLNLITTIALCILSVSMEAQKSLFNTKPIQIEEAIAIEKEFHSKEMISKTKYTFFDQEADFAQPKIFKRISENSSEPPIVRYFYNKKNNKVQIINYDWQINPDRAKLTQRMTDDYNVLFEKVLNSLTHEFGQPDPNQGEVKTWIDETVQTSDANGNVAFRANGTIHDRIANEKIIRTFEMENTPFPAQIEYLEFEKLTEKTSRLAMQIIYRTVELSDQMLRLPFAHGLNMAHNRLQEIFNK